MNQKLKKYKFNFFASFSFLFDFQIAPVDPTTVPKKKKLRPPPPPPMPPPPAPPRVTFDVVKPAKPDEGKKPPRRFSKIPN